MLQLVYNPCTTVYTIFAISSTLRFLTLSPGSTPLGLEPWLLGTGCPARKEYVKRFFCQKYVSINVFLTFDELYFSLVHTRLSIFHSFPICVTFVEKVDLCLRILNNTEPVMQKRSCQNLTSKQCLLKWLGLARRREEILYPVSSNLLVLSLSSEPWPKIISYFAYNTLILQDII